MFAWPNIPKACKWLYISGSEHVFFTDAKQKTIEFHQDIVFMSDS